MTRQNEDIEYTSVDDFAIAEDNHTFDVDQPNKKVLEEVSEELAKDIKEHSDVKSIYLEQNATPEQKIAAYDQIAIHKGLVLYLEKYKTMIDNKIRELR